MPESYDPPLIPPDANDDEGLEPTPDDAGLPVVEVSDDVAPLGRSWAFDTGLPGFVMAGTGVLQTTGTQTLVQWIDKAIHTERGSLEIHPPDYGMREPLGWFGHGVMQLSVGDLENDLRDCLTFHPRIADVINVRMAVDPLDDAVTVSYDVVLDPPLDEGDTLSMRTRV